MSTRNVKGPDKDMEQPKAYKSSIDAKKPQPTMNMSTKQTQYKPGKSIDFNNKVSEYKPNNNYYKTSFWEAPKRKMIPQPQRKNEIPVPKPQPKPKQSAPKRAAAPPPKPQNSTLKPLPQANFNTRKAKPVPQSQPLQPKPSPAAQSPPQYVEPESWSPSPPPQQVEHWAEPTKVIPDLNLKPRASPKEQDFSGLPSTVGSMTRMMAMFT